MTVRIYISGFVQNVGFRQYIKYKAKKLNVSGWVKNLSDGRVEALVQGDEQNVKKMIGVCRRGPFLARVKEIKIVNEEEINSMKSFEVVKQ